MTIPLLPPAQLVVLSGSIPLATAFAISSDHLAFAAVCASAVAAVAGAIAWIDARIRTLTAAHAESIREHGAILREIRETMTAVQINGCARACHDPDHRRKP